MQNLAIETASGKELNWTQTWLFEEEEFFANTDNLMRGFEAELAVVAVMFQEDYWIARQQEIVVLYSTNLVLT